MGVWGKGSAFGLHPWGETAS